MDFVWVPVSWWEICLELRNTINSTNRSAQQWSLALYFLLHCLFLYFICSSNPYLDASGFRDHSYDQTLFTHYFSGLIFTFMYNCFASTLRALGDSKSPLYFLIISSVVNVFGDLVFVLIFHMGSEGCAISTILSEAISCLLCIIYIQKKIPILRLGKKWLVFDPSLFKTDHCIWMGFCYAAGYSTA